MPANKLITSSTSEDSESLIPFFEGIKLEDDEDNLGMASYVWDARWTVPEIVWGSGSAPSYALITIPTLNVDSDRGNQVAFQPTDIKHGSRVYIRRKATSGIGQIVFAGSVTAIRHDKGTDSLQITAHDDVYLMRGVPIVGRFGIHGYGTESNSYPLTFFQGLPCYYNHGGRPNAILSSEGYWVFAPYPDFGITAEDNPEDIAVADLGKKATYWTLSKMLSYFQTFYSSNAFAEHFSNWKWIITLDDSKVEFNAGFGGNVDSDSVAKFDSTGDTGQQSRGFGRKGRPFNFDGVDLATAIETVMQSTGGWSYVMVPNEDDEGTVKNTLTAVLNIYKGVGMDVPIAMSGEADPVLMQACVTGGQYEENSIDFFPQVAVIADTVYVERRVDTKTTGSLFKAWSEAEETALKAYVAANGGDAEAWHEAKTKFPYVYTTWKLSLDYDALEGTVYEHYPRSVFTKMVLTQLLSYRPATSGLTDFRASAFDISVEYATQGSSTWTTSSLSTGLEVFDNGVIMMPGLRELEHSFRWTGTQYASAPEEKDIRLTLAIGADFRFSACVALLLGDDSQSLDTMDIVFQRSNEMPDYDKVDGKMQRTHLVNAGGLYSLWLRKGSWPTPQSTVGATQAQDYAGERLPMSQERITSALRADTDLILGHARKVSQEYSRLNKSGSVLKLDGYLVSEFKVGTPISNLIDINDPEYKFPINACIQQVKWCSANGDVHTEWTLK
jgi:hypothetical protein